VAMTAVEKLSPEEYLARRVDQLDGHWLELQCGCGAQVFYPFKLLTKTCGAKRVDQIHRRFRCRQCGGRPVRVGVTNDPARGPQYPDAWSLTLLDATGGDRAR
jgi:hypothetical protein